MAGTLTISTLSDGTNSTSSTNCIKGSAKAWGNFSAQSGTITVRGSYNVSSITRQSTGNYTINFTTAMADINYSIATSGGTGGGGGLAILYPYNSGNNPTAPTTSAFQMWNASTGATAFDNYYYAFSVFGN